MTIANASSLTPQLIALTHFAKADPRLFDLLLTQFGTVEEIMLAEDEDLAMLDSLTVEQKRRLVDAPNHLAEASAVLKSLTDRQIAVTNRFELEYPDLLNELHNPPTLLYTRGTLPQNSQKRVAIAGSETAHEDAITLAAELTRRLAKESISIVAGLYSAIDSAAHLSSRAANLPSYAVLDGGFDEIGTSELMPLAIDIVQNGGLISEYLPAQKSIPRAYQASNRLIAAFSNAVIFCELDSSSPRLNDLIDVCGEIGKLCFYFIDHNLGVLADEPSLQHATKNGVIIIEGYEKLPDIVRSLV